jgi:hypothetical protein
VAKKIKGKIKRKNVVGQIRGWLVRQKKALQIIRRLYRQGNSAVVQVVIILFWGGFGFYPPGSVSNHLRFNDRRDREQKRIISTRTFQAKSFTFPLFRRLDYYTGGGEERASPGWRHFLSCVIGGILFLLKTTFFWKRGAVIRNGNNRKPSIPPPPHKEW